MGYEGAECWAITVFYFPSFWGGGLAALPLRSEFLWFVKSAGNAAMRIIIVPKRVSSPSAGEGGLRGVHFDLLAFIRTGFYPVPLIAGLDTGLQSKAQARGPVRAGTAKPFWSSRAESLPVPLLLLWFCCLREPLAAELWSLLAFP